MVRSILLYGAPVWARSDVFKFYSRIIPLIRIQRCLDQRAVCAYRTVSGTAAGLIAGSSPIDFLARAYKYRYDRLAEIRHTGPSSRNQKLITIPPRTIRQIMIETHQDMINGWKVRLLDMGPTDSGLRTRNILLPIFDEWVSRPFGSVDYRMCQFLSGHGCFAAFMHRIGKVGSPGCPHCTSVSDTVWHTFFECLEWSQHRIRLESQIGISSLFEESVVTYLVSDQYHWTEVSIFINILLHKEAAERERQRRSLEH